MFFFFNDTATTEIYTLSLHDALPISARLVGDERAVAARRRGGSVGLVVVRGRRAARIREVHEPVAVVVPRSEEHTSELQSRQYLVCRLLLEKKKYISSFNFFFSNFFS